MTNKLKNVSISEMLAEIKRRNEVLAELEVQRDRLTKELAVVEQKMSALSATSGAVVKSEKKAAKVKKTTKGKAKRASRKGGAKSLAAVMKQVMSKDKASSLAEIESAVLKTGYKTKSARFRTIIMQTLSKDGGFKRVARGQYSLK